MLLSLELDLDLLLCLLRFLSLAWWSASGCVAAGVGVDVDLAVVVVLFPDASPVVPRAASPIPAAPPTSLSTPKGSIISTDPPDG